MKAFPSILFILLTLLVSCGDDPDLSGDPQAGTIERVISYEVFVNEVRAFNGAPLAVQSDLSTDKDGSVLFQLKDKLESCIMKPNSGAKILPPPHLIEFKAGEHTCGTYAGDTRSAYLQAGTAAIEVRQAAFGVSVSERQTEVQVFRGFAEVRRQGADPGQGPLLGPEVTTTLAAGDQPLTLTPLDMEGLDSAERRIVSQTGGEPDFSPPDSDGSPALRRVKEARTINVAVDRGGSEQSHKFTESFLAFLGERWGVEIKRQVATSTQAEAALRSGMVDVVVTSGELPGGRSLVFFEDDTERVWSLQVSSDDGRFEAALAGFLKPALEVGEYGRRYLAAFGRVPTYEALRPLVFPPIHPVGSSPSRSPGTSAPFPVLSPPVLKESPNPPATTGPLSDPPSNSSPPSPLHQRPITAPATQCNGKVATIVGGPGPDQLRGTEGPDVIAGLEGDDEIHGGGGDDTICGSQGDDRMYGDDGRDDVAGDEGDDLAYGGRGEDAVSGEEGKDRLNGGEGADLLSGGIGDDLMWGNAGADRMQGGDGHDTIVSNAGHGEDGSADVLEGDAGDDLLNAPDGLPNDVLNGGPDKDRCRADPGEPTFECETFS